VRDAVELKPGSYRLRSGTVLHFYCLPVIH
jgi:hypothetical protein